MPARRVAEPYPINDGHRIRMVVRHRYIKGSHVGVHRAQTRDRPLATHRRSRTGPALILMVGLAALPLLVILTLPARLLPSPYPGPGRVPGFTNQDRRTTVPNESPQRPPTRTTIPTPRPTPTPKPPTRTQQPSKAPTSKPATPGGVIPSLPLPSLPIVPSDPTNGLVPELPLDTPAVGDQVKDVP